MFKNKKYVIFDFDGTTVNSQDIFTSVDEELIKLLGKEPKSTIGEDRMKFYTKNHQLEDTFIEYYKYLLKVYELNYSIEEFIKIRNQIYERHIKEHASLKPGIELFIDELKKRNKVLFLATTSNITHVNRFFTNNTKIKNKLSLIDTFGNNILTWDNVKIRKPNPEIYFKALGILNADPSECIAIEDELIGIEAAKRAALEVIAIYDKNSDFEREKINTLSDYHANNFDELIDILEEEEPIN